MSARPTDIERYRRGNNNRLTVFIQELIRRGVDPSLITQWVAETGQQIGGLINRFAEYEESQINARGQLERQANRPYEPSPIHERIRSGQLHQVTPAKLPASSVKRQRTGKSLINLQCLSLVV